MDADHSSKRQEKRDKAKSKGDRVYSSKHVRKQEALQAKAIERGSVAKRN